MNNVGELDGIPVFATQKEAENYAQSIGCEGSHPHQYEGKEVYMPCDEHGEVLDMIQDKGISLEDMLKDYKLVGVKPVDNPEEISNRYLERLSTMEMNSQAFYRIVSNPNEPSILDLPWRRYRYIYAPGEGAPDLISTSRSFCTRMLAGRQRVFRYEDILDLSAQLEVEDTNRRIIPRPKDSGPVSIWLWKGGAGCLHRFIQLVFEPEGYIYDNARQASEEAIMQMPADGQTGQINLPPNYASGFAKVGEKGAIVKSDKAPKSDTPNPNPKGEGSAKGDANTTRGAEVSERVEKILEDKVKDFNERYKEKLGYGANKGALKSVYQRGVGAYNTSHSPEVKSAEQWALARVNAFLYLLRTGRPENSKYVNDNDLLPKEHPKHSKEEFDYNVSSLSPYSTTTGTTDEEQFIEKKPYEREKDYIGRCMGSEKMKSEYPDEKQRYAVCISDFESFSKDSKKVIIVDIDDTIVKNGKPMNKTIEYIDEKKDDYRIVIISGRPIARLEETKKELQDLGVYYDEIYLQDFAEKTSGEVGKKFKEYKAKKLYESGFTPVEAIENDPETRSVYESLGIDALDPEKVDVFFKPQGFSNGIGIFENPEEAIEYSEFCGCGGMIEPMDFLGKKMYWACSTKKQEMVAHFSMLEDKRMIYTPIMIPNIVIPRSDEFGGRYFVRFSPESISKMAYKYLKEKRTDKVNYEHSNKKLEDVYMVESWIVNSDRDKAYDFFEKEQIPIGTWMAGFKVESDEVWNNYVKTNKVKGASLQGNFLYIN